MKAQSLKKFKLPDKPGVYFFKKGKEILYIGKATSLRDRVRSYFSKDLIETRGPRLVDMVFRADKISWATTDSVLEALILEAELIKKHQPYYNSDEKDDKSWNYVCITDEKLPEVAIVRGKELKEGKTPERFSEVFGPFTNGGQLKEAMKIIRPIFPYIDADSRKKDNFAFYRQLHLAPETADALARRAYGRNIANLKLFFRGKKKRILSNLKKEMMAYAKRREFEQAGEVKRRIFALQHINDVALLKGERMAAGAFRIEAYDIAHMSGQNMVGVMTVVESGQPVKSEYKKFKIRSQSGANDTGALAEILDRRLAHTEWDYPRLIVLDGSTAQINAARNIMAKIGVQIPIAAVTKNERHRPVAIRGEERFIRAREDEILLANAEAHRFAIAYHKKMRSKNFLGLRNK
ncbi:MAG TPA: hypothetical protein VG694_01800 [Candidatus Paceibacterota bacterium]|nr:hypothetical protein [Candidatus Paceibacterota bacterium]